MKPFDLEAAKRGEPVVLGNGAKVIDFKWWEKTKTFEVLIEYTDGQKNYSMYGENGKFYKSIDDESLDLFMAPKKIKLYVNIYKGEDGYVCSNPSTTNIVFKNIEKNHLKTIEIEVDE